MPRTFHLYPVRVSDQDLDTAVRTVFGEAQTEGPIGQQAVAGAIRNRAMLSGRTISDVIRTGGFTGYNAAAQALQATSPEYQAIRSNIEGVLRGSATNPAGNATSFYAPKRVSHIPRWATDNGGGQPIGNQIFVAVPFPYSDRVKLPPAEPGTFGQPARPFPPPAPGPKPPEAVPTLETPRPRAALAPTSAVDPSGIAAAGTAPAGLPPPAGDTPPVGLAPEHAAALAALLEPMAATGQAMAQQAALVDALQVGPSGTPPPFGPGGAPVDPALLARLLARSGGAPT